ncbi:Cna B-type domain-containing protein, partial [uncultured Granulicatella sp.]|uniref:Cna B-type domain-containing protein n=1 Tax=uncultured Granulicatella sp. TaxID=316089 RepID=UPI00263469F0
NTAKFESRQTGPVDRNAIGILTPSAGIADAPSDPLSIKLLKSDVKTGRNLSEGFKFELQVSDDGISWNAVDINNEMVVKGTLNTDKTLTPDESGIVEVKRLNGGKKYRFFEKAHADRYKDVTEDNSNPNTNKTPTAANSRVVEISTQGTGKVIVMYNEQKPEMVKVEGSKTWDDADNQDGKRPAQIIVNLLKNGQKVASKTVTEADGWKWTFDNLDKYENGKEIAYTVEEEAIEGYTSKVNGFNITNTYAPAKTSVQVTKKWDDADDKDGKRPTSVTITLYANGEKTDKTLVLNKENHWTESFTEVDEYKAGKKIDYSVQEEPVGNGYVSEISGDQAGGFTVTNTRKPDAPVTTETPTTPVTTTTEEGEKELPNTGTTGSLAVIGFIVLIAATLVITVKTKKA